VPPNFITITVAPPSHPSTCKIGVRRGPRFQVVFRPDTAMSQPFSPAAIIPGSRQQTLNFQEFGIKQRGSRRSANGVVR
jgi:hypothetical protein